MHNAGGTGSERLSFLCHLLLVYKARHKARPVLSFDPCLPNTNGSAQDSPIPVGPLYRVMSLLPSEEIWCALKFLSSVIVSELTLSSFMSRCSLQGCC